MRHLGTTRTARGWARRLPAVNPRVNIKNEQADKYSESAMVNIKNEHADKTSVIVQSDNYTNK